MPEQTQTAPATPAAPSTPSAPNAPKKGKSATTIIIIVVVVLAVLGIGGYLISRYLAEKTAEGLIGGLTGGEVDVSASKVTYSGEGGSLEFSEGAKWPTDLPSDVPEFTYGTVKATAKTTSDGKGNWSITLENVQSGAYDKYVSDLKAAGWEEATTSTAEGVNYIDMSKGSYDLIFTYEENEKTASLLVSSKSE
ncbi:MAG: hypothetical protein OEV37_00870 [Candidatus Berkelbacteria bacterium]|nr:hypothetical protein [Candidatus Berkelbacteria bacterium]